MSKTVPVVELYSINVSCVRQADRVFYYVVLDLGFGEHLRLHVSRAAWERLGGAQEKAPADSRQLGLGY